MAVTISIPMTFEFRPYPATWLYRWATVLGFSKQRYEASRPLIHYLGSDEDLDVEITSDGLESLFGLDSVLDSADYRARLTASGIPASMLNAVPPLEEQSVDETGQVEILTCSRLVFLEPGKERDAWQMRDEFFGLKRNTRALTDFLDKWGIWDSYTIQRQTEAPRLFAPLKPGTNSDPDDWRSRLQEHFVFPEKIWDLREYYRAALIGPDDEWLAYVDGMSAVLAGKIADTPPEQKRAETLIRTASMRSRYPHFLVKRNYCRDAIEATITMDLLRKAKIRSCKRSACRKPYEITSRHKRQYCSQYCAHLESMRRQSRDKAKKKKTQIVRKKG